ncbi:hypothetical protein UO65_4247 [Actinokineospora spheciospongiae]|uniref:Uncharacterized protein n=1 Tax=Actinokineospora spheciospongiae TaxID=909613 RepID=W7J2S6_9PSEU|nr:DUF5682 family protein [Actinokineospora spheciospongiae]EWC60434.1 hypothetical protein UO65_4247 [Actinokineospora spheciospongiae]
MPAEFIGVRHHSPACARLVAARIAELRPAYVLVEGPVDMNDRLDELLLGHELPIAVFSYLRAEGGTRMSWSPFCDHSPEWVALTAGRAAGAEVRFIDLPAWHSAFAERDNRYSDGALRYSEVTARLCREFAVDNSDTLWDHMVEVHADLDPVALAERLNTYFDVLRGETTISTADDDRETYMAAWVRAAVAAAGDRPVLVITGGLHRPALIPLAATGGTAWPEVPTPPAGSEGDSYLVPYSNRRLDAFQGYQSGLPSPGYYERLWADGPARAAEGLLESVATRLRDRNQRVSTADLIAARTQAGGLAALRGHPHPARTDVLDALVSALVSDGLEQRLPWTSDGTIAPGAHPVVVQMVAALTGDRVGRLHDATPAPPLLSAVDGELAALALDRAGRVTLDLTGERDLRRSRVLHRLRVLGIPGVRRTSGPTGGADPTSAEVWELTETDLRLPALIEAAAYGATLPDAAAVLIRRRVTDPDTGVAELAAALYDTALCGVDALSSDLGERIADRVATASDLGAVGAALGTVLGLWRHDRLLGSAGSPVLAEVIDAAATRVLWLAEGTHGGTGPADVPRLHALAALRDALRHAEPVVGVRLVDVLGVAQRIATRADVPPDLAGAGLGLSWALGAPGEVHVPTAPNRMGDWLAGLFALAREEVLADESVLATLDGHVADLGDDDFLVALPALRQAFAFFPPAERETIAHGLLARRGLRRSARALLRTTVDPVLAAEAAALESRVEDLLVREGLLPGSSPQTPEGTHD